MARGRGLPLPEITATVQRAVEHHDGELEVTNDGSRVTIEYGWLTPPRRRGPDYLDRRWFIGLNWARSTDERWRQDGRQTRPRSALRYQPPVEFRRSFEEIAVLRQEWDGLPE